MPVPKGNLPEGVIAFFSNILINRKVMPGIHFACFIEGYVKFIGDVDLMKRYSVARYAVPPDFTDSFVAIKDRQL